MNDMTFAEKILTKYGHQKTVEPNQIVTIQPDHLLSHDNTAAIIQKIQPELKKYGVYNKNLSIIVLITSYPPHQKKPHKTINSYENFSKHIISKISMTSVQESAIKSW